MAEEDSGKSGRDYVLTPPDGGWGWMVCAGSFVIMMMLGSIGSVFGILYLNLFLELRVSSTVIAWIFNLNWYRPVVQSALAEPAPELLTSIRSHLSSRKRTINSLLRESIKIFQALAGSNETASTSSAIYLCGCVCIRTLAITFFFQTFLWNIGGLFAGPLCDIFGWRKVSFIGCLGASVAMMVSAFASAPWHMYLVFSVCLGISGGLGLTTTVLVLPYYFEKRRGLATALLVSGVSAGMFISPIVVRLLIDAHGHKVAVLLYGAIMLNATIGALMFHPVEWHAKKVYKVASESNELLNEKVLPSRIQSLDFKGERSLKRRESLKIAASITNIASVSLAKAKDTDDREESNAEPTSFLQVIKTVFSSIVEYLKILRNTRCIIISLGFSFFLSGYVNFIMQVPFILEAKSFTLEQTSWTISISGVCNLIFRLGTSSSSDLPGFNKKICYMAGSVITSIAIFVFPLLNSFPLMIITMAVWGSGIGMNISLFSLVMIQQMGIEQFPKVYGATNCVTAFVCIVTGPLVGVIRDVVGSYIISTWILSVFTLLLFVLWLFMPLAISFDKRREEREMINLE